MKKCQICNENTFSYYPLCKKHLDMIKEGLVIKNEETGKWQLKENKVKNDIWKKNQIEEKQNYKNCIICEQSTNEGWRYLCKDCYFTTLQYIRELDKNMNAISFKDYYYNLKQNIYRMTGYNRFVKPSLLKLIAIAKANSRYNNNDELLNKVENDVRELIEKKKDKDFIKEEKQIIEYNEKVQKKEHRSQDGHFLDSQIEITIDDILFTSNIPHAIHYPVFEITERPVYCDWFIPYGKGIYIELWGMDKKDYIDNKQEKIELYQKHNLNLLMFDKQELNDTFNVKRNLLTKIEEFKNK